MQHVTELMKRQIDLDVVLVDFLDNDSTHGKAYWKTTQKVLAYNRDLYNKLTSQHTDLEVASIDFTCEDTAEESDSSGTSQ